MSDSPNFSSLNLSSIDILKLVVDLDLLPLLIRRYIEKSHYSSFHPSESEQISYQKSFLAKERIDTSQELQKWLSANQISEPQLSKKIYNSLQLQQFKKSFFSKEVESTFLRLKPSLDRVMYSLIRTRERAKAFELHLRIIEEESTFAQLASEFSEGIEQQLNGLIGPIELGKLNSHIAERLRISKQGQLWEPFQQDGWWVILRLEKLLPSKLDELMTQRIIDDLHDKWILNLTKLELDNLINTDPVVAKMLLFEQLSSHGEESSSQNIDLPLHSSHTVSSSSNADI